MVLHLGGTRVLGLLVTTYDDQGAELVELIRPDMTVPIHYDDTHVFRSSLEDFVPPGAPVGSPARCGP